MVIARGEITVVKLSDGTSQYTHIRYSENSNGNPMIVNSTPTTKYMGVAITTSPTAPAGYSSYAWSKFVGETGRGVESVDEEFYLSSDKTSQTGGSWLPDPPPWISGKYMWTRFKTTYTNPAGTEYTTPSVSSEWEAVNDIQIGGRNLLKNSGVSATGTSYSLSGYYWTNTSDMVPGNKYTITIEGNLSVGQTGWHFNLYTDNPVTYQTAINLYDEHKIGDNKWIGTFIIPNLTAGQSFTGQSTLYALPFNQEHALPASVTRIKLEKGNKATDWTPAPEDVAADIAEVSDTLSNLSDTIIPALEDNLITKAEQSAIKASLKQFQNEKADLDAQYSIIYYNSKLTNPAKTNLLNAKNGYGTKYTALDTAITNILNVASGEISTALQTAYTTAFTNYKTSLATLSTRLSEATRSIEDKISADVDNLEIGGRNLLKYSEMKNYGGGNLSQNTFYTINKDKIIATGQSLSSALPGFKVETVTNTEVTVSGYCSVTTGVGLYYMCFNSADTATGNQIANDITVDTNGYFSKTITINAPAGTAYINVGIGSTANANYWISAKLEKGNKATDWTSAPEDVDESIAKTTPFINGTQTAATSTWKGIAPFSKLENGQQITYKLPFNGVSNATLNLTLSDGSTTGDIACYFKSTSRLTTHYGQGSVIRLTYLVNNLIGATNYTGWWADANYYTDTIDRLRYNTNIQAKTAITAGWLVVADASNQFFHLAYNVPFRIDKPILYAQNSISASSTGNSNYTVYPSFSVRTNSLNSSLSFTTYNILYVKGTLNGLEFTPKQTPNLYTTTEPTYDDGFVYLAIGQMGTTYQAFLYGQHELYVYKNGGFKSLTASSVKTTIDQYYLSTLSTALSGGAWQDTMPVGGSANYMWKRTKIIFNDGTAEYKPSANGRNMADEMFTVLTKDGEKFGCFVDGDNPNSLYINANYVSYPELLKRNGVFVNGIASFFNRPKLTIIL